MDKKAMLNKLVMLLDWFNGFTDSALQFICGPLVDFVLKVSGENGEEWIEKFKLFLRGELVAKEPKWREQDGVIYFSVTSNGLTGKEWIARMGSKGFRVRNYAKSVLLSSDFKPAKKGEGYNIVVIKGEFFADEKRITSNIRAEADCRKWSKPNAEIACLIREKFTDKEIEAMGLQWVVVMHELIKDSDGDSCLLGASRYGDGSHLSASYGFPDGRWDRDEGFAFVVPSVVAEAMADKQV